MVQYNTGTVNTSLSSDVHGIGTTWLTDSNVVAGDLFKILNSDVIYTVSSVASNSKLTLTAVYAGPLVSEVGYQITRDFTPNYSFPEVHAGDIDWPNIITQALRDIDNEMNINSDISSGIVSDLVWITSDLASVKSDLIATRIDIVADEAIITANTSDIVADRSDIFNAIRDAQAALAAGDSANFSDVMYTMYEVLVAFSDALPYN